MESPYEVDVKHCVETMKNDGVILYPTDTIWGLGCDAHHEKAIEKIFEIKKRDKQKSFVILMTDVRQLSKYIADPLPDLDSLLAKFTEPTSVIYPNGINLPAHLMSQDGSIAVRITKDPFCRALIKRLRSPIVSTSANISGGQSASSFDKISKEIVVAADYVVTWRQDERHESSASAILKLEPNGTFLKIR